MRPDALAARLRREAPPSALRTLLVFALGTSAANVVGALVVFVYSTLVVPPVDLDDGSTPRSVFAVNLQLFVGYLVVALLLGAAWSTYRFRPVLRWLASGRAPDDDEREATLRAPARQLTVTAALWAVAVVVFGAVNLRYDAELARNVVLAVLLGGLTTCALGYLVGQWLLRPLAGVVLGGQAPLHPVGPRVQTRLLLVWALGTAVPFSAVVLATLLREDFAAAAPVVFLCVVGVVAGGGLTLLLAREVARPIDSVRRAVVAVGDGDLDVDVDVDDGSEIGMLQSGVNHMVVGLRERQRIYDLFGRQVGADVARTAIDRGVRLGGEVRRVAVLFVDVVGSTDLPRRLSPEDVVAELNRFFGVVVDVVDRTGGWVNKFQGDATLCVYGAPADHPEAADAALRAARELGERLRRETALDAGIGVSFGAVVAGNVGSTSRFEYTVVGDAVNEASRLTELAKGTPERVLVSRPAVEASRDEERARWQRFGSVRLRGRLEPTHVMGPRHARPPARLADLRATEPAAGPVAAAPSAGSGAGAPSSLRVRRPARAGDPPSGAAADAGGHIEAMSLSTRSSTAANGSLHSTVRCAWSFTLRCTQSTVTSRRRAAAAAMKRPRSAARVVGGATVLASNVARSVVARSTSPLFCSR